MVMKLLIVSFMALFLLEARAGRPLITDDASVVGDRDLQIESWFFVDERSLQHWIVPTVGYKDLFEFSASVVHGESFKDKKVYAISGPILQTKVVLNKGLAFSGGGVAPYGQGAFKTTDWDYFYYFAGTYHNFANDALIAHVNLGQQTRRQSGNMGSVILWGLALEYDVGERVHVFSEFANGDTYALIQGIAVQAGFRYDFTPTLQFDGTLERADRRPNITLLGNTGSENGVRLLVTSVDALIDVHVG